MNIERHSGGARGRSRAVAWDNLVFTVATAPSKSNLAVQTRKTLELIDKNLAEAGSDKTRLLSATVYVTDITQKGEMDAEWNAWIGAENWPQRACIEVGLAQDTLVEITAIAVKA